MTEQKAGRPPENSASTSSHGSSPEKSTEDKKVDIELSEDELKGVSGGAAPTKAWGLVVGTLASQAV